MAVWSNTALSTIKTQFGRFDAEFYKPEFLDTDRTLSSIDCVTLRRVASKIDVGHVGPMVRHYSDTGVLLLQTQNVREFFLELSNSVRIAPEFHASLVKSQVHKGNILIARSGSFGSAAIYLENAVINSADIIIVQIDDPRINPLYAVTFMNTQYGSVQFVRFASGGVQGHVNLRILEHFRIPILDEIEQEQIAEVVQEAYAARTASSEMYSEAQQLFEKELGLDKLTFQKTVGYNERFGTVGLSTILSVGRIDAQCFAPDALLYDSWLQARGQCDRLASLVRSTAKGRQHADIPNGLIDYCSIKHISRRELVDVSRCSPSPDTPMAGLDDLLLAITGATIGKIGIVKRYERLAFSGDLLCLLTAEQIDPHYLLLALDHRLGQVQFTRWITGSTNGHLAWRDIARVLVPRLDDDTEAKIAVLVKNSLSKRWDSDQLLDNAKGRVEQLIKEIVHT
ncbi:MAG: restriction endonuclease subunit S [Gemmatimonadota bacterium]|nr:restriction endonuclease subunit S [Gemmatimonadota bacterium]